MARVLLWARWSYETPPAPSRPRATSGRPARTRRARARRPESSCYARHQFAALESRVGESLGDHVTRDLFASRSSPGRRDHLRSLGLLPFADVRPTPAGAGVVCVAAQHRVLRTRALHRGSSQRWCHPALPSRPDRPTPHVNVFWPRLHLIGRDDKTFIDASMKLEAAGEPRPVPARTR